MNVRKAFRRIHSIKLLLLILLLYTPYTWASPSPDPSLKDIFGVWEIVEEAFFEEGTLCRPGSVDALEVLMGKKIEFRRDYLIVDGKQHNRPAYLWRVYSSPLELSCNRDRHLDYTLNTKEGPILYVEFERYTDYLVYREKDEEFHAGKEYPIWNLILDQDQLILDLGYHVVVARRCAAPSTWQRACARLKLWLLPDSYDPRKEVAPEIFGRWEVYESKAKRPRSEAKQALAVEYIGKQIEIRPEYLVLDGVRYEKPRYWKSSEDDTSVNLDRHSNYCMLDRPCHDGYAPPVFWVEGESLRMGIKDFSLTLKRVYE